MDRPGTPKPMVDVGGQPLLVRLIEQLERAGIQRITVIVGYGGSKISRLLRGHAGIRSDIQIIKNPLWRAGLASSIACARGIIDEPFLLAMADHVFDDGLILQMVNQQPAPAGVIALVDRRIDLVPSLGSAVKVKTQAGQVVSIGRHLDVFDAIDTGLFVAAPELLDSMAPAAEDRGELADALQKLALAGRVKAVGIAEGCWHDVDRPADLIRAEMHLRRQRRELRVVAARSEPTRMVARSFEFVVGRPITSGVMVGRGFVEEPGSISLIPDASASSPNFVFTDTTVHALYGERFVRRLRALGYDVHAIVLSEGEEAKTMANYCHLIERVLSRGVDERSVFISLGGGVVCNVCGFVASTIYRGLDLVHVPTTLMAQCDAAISHKQGINSHRGKNMVGTYFSPRLIAVDVEVLRSLPDRLLRDGMAEAIKHAIGQDASYSEMLLSATGDLRDLDLIEAIVCKNIELKCRLARQDPQEHKEGIVLQYGHTVGHPIEHLSGYRLYHGESVAIGMMVAARVARILGAGRPELVRTHTKLLEHFGLPTAVPRGIRTDDVINALRYNKRHLTEGCRMALLSDVGKLWCVEGDYAIPVSEQVLRKALEATRSELF